MRKKLLVIIFLLGLSIALLGNPSPSEAGTIIVGGGCTLVDAVIAANSDNSTGFCPAGSGDDTIIINRDIQVNGPYAGSTTIGGGQAALPDITSNISIMGNGHTIGTGFFNNDSFRLAYVAPGANLEIYNAVLNRFEVWSVSGNAEGGLLYIDAGATVVLHDSTTSNNRTDARGLVGVGSGSAVFNHGTLNADNVIVTFNVAWSDSNGISGKGGAFYNTGTMSITNSSFTINAIAQNTTLPVAGGVIYSNGTLNIDNTLFFDNEVHNEAGDSYGGALAVEGPTTIVNSTFYHNIAVHGNGYEGHGGAIAINTLESVHIQHATFVDNTVHGTNAGEVIYVVSGLPLIEGSIIASQGYDGGLFFAPPPDGPDCFGPMIGSNNLTRAGDTSCNSISSGTIELDTHVSTTLADNGGPTHTLALIDVAGNPAINGNPNCGLLTDQRNYDRDVNCDIGAFELKGVPPTVTPTFTPTDTLTPTNTLTPTFTNTATNTATASPTATAISMDLSVSAACNGPDLDVTIASGETPFEITASGGGNLPVTVGFGNHTILGPDKWDNLTITEQSGDGQSINLGTFRCRTDERPVPLSPAHRSRITNPFPTFSWTGISDANNYRVFVFDEADPGLRTVDIRQNSGGPTNMQLTTPLPIDRLFWRVRGRQNRVWSLWSIRFTLFVDPPTAQESVVTPVPTIQLDVPISTPVPTIGPPDGGLTPVPTLIQPPNSR